MRFEKFTIKSQESLQAAQRSAETRGNPQVEPEHLLSALLDQEGGVVSSLLHRVGADVASVQGECAARLDKLPRQKGAGLSLALSRDLTSVLEQAFEESVALKDEYVSTEHLLLALLSTGRMGEVLTGQGVDKAAVLAALKDVRGSQRVTVL